MNQQQPAGSCLDDPSIKQEPRDLDSSECRSHGFTDDAISLNHKRWTHASILKPVLTRTLDNVKFIPVELLCCTMQFRCDGQVHCLHALQMWSFSQHNFLG